MKVLIGMTRSDTTLSGSFTHIRQIGEAFRRQGTEVIYALGGNGVAIEKLQQDGFRVISLPLLKREIAPFSDFLVLLQLIWLILTERPEACSWHTAKIGALGRIASFLTRRRSYYVAHGVPFVNTPANKGYKLYERIERWLAWLPSKIICVCRFDYNEYRRIRVDASRLMTIPNGMGGKITGSDDRSAKSHVHRFVTAARFEPQKDYETLAAACRLLHTKNAKFELHIYGNGRLENEVRSSFSDFPVGAIQFHGVVDNFSEALSGFDTFLLCSHWEGLPRSIIEALACGRPVIASDVGGCSELVQPGVNGYLVPPRDPMALASTMLRYIEDPDLAVAHGKNGRAIYLADYTLDVMLSRYCAEYLGVKAA